MGRLETQAFVKKFGLIGGSLSHSFSPHYFKEKFDSLGLVDHSYELFEISDATSFDEVLNQSDVAGLNVTIPHKTSIIPFLQELSPAAAEIGAVNCLQRINNRWIGHNTDVDGIKATLATVGFDKVLVNALILGDGGASKAVAYVLKNMGIDYKVVSRSGDFTFHQLTPSKVREVQLIVQTTPLGMYPNTNDCPDIPYEAITSKHVLFDLIYHPSETVFLKKGRLAGAQTINGELMLKVQAERSWEIWNQSN